ncbi:energy transducer TonB [Gilvibacter sp.]|uniref:energy transducer TonB n=1 Tax=Gilvibacter sp. TaxID=2729997 RepID=UPI003F4A0D3F
MEIKKNPKVKISGWSHIFFLFGLALMLFLSWRALEWETKEQSALSFTEIDLEAEFQDDIPITEIIDNAPPPPPPPTIVQTSIEIVADDLDIEETVIESTETNQEEGVVIEIDEVEEVEEEEELITVPFHVIEEVPIYPGCEALADKTAKKKCLSDKVMAFVQKNFDTDLAVELGLEGRQRISVQFRIDERGKVVEVKARAPHPRLEQEAISIVSKLPLMSPGMQRGKPVGVLYMLPILFQVETPH